MFRYIYTKNYLLFIENFKLLGVLYSIYLLNLITLTKVHGFIHSFLYSFTNISFSANFGPVSVLAIRVQQVTKQNPHQRLVHIKTKQRCLWTPAAALPEEQSQHTLLTQRPVSNVWTVRSPLPNPDKLRGGLRASLTNSETKVTT